jgi:hypothetical protein
MGSPCYPGCPPQPPANINVTPQQFQTQFPEFQNVTQAMIQMWISAAPPFFNVQRWGDLLNLGVLFWVAHQIKLGQANADQPLTDDSTMQKAGDVSYMRDSKLVNAQAENPYMRTTYGQQYLYYMRLVGAGATAL